MQKSFLALALCGSVIQRNPWPDQTAGLPEPGKCFWLETEGRQRLNYERAQGLGIDTSGIFMMPEAFRTYYLDKSDDFKQVAGMVREIGPDLIVVDSWSKALSGKENDSDMRHALDALQGLARETDAAILLIHHVRKPQMTDDPESFDIHRLRGTSVLAQCAVAVLGVDLAQKGRPLRRLTRAKGTVSATEPEATWFLVEDGQIRFDLPPPEREPADRRREEAREFLREALANGPRVIHEVKAEAATLDIAEETLLRAKREIAEHRKQTGTGKDVVWLWGLKGYWDGDE